MIKLVDKLLLLYSIYARCKSTYDNNTYGETYYVWRYYKHSSCTQTTRHLIQIWEYLRFPRASVPRSLSTLLFAFVRISIWHLCWRRLVTGFGFRWFFWSDLVGFFCQSDFLCWLIVVFLKDESMLSTRVVFFFFSVFSYIHNIFDHLQCKSIPSCFLLSKLWNNRFFIIFKVSSSVPCGCSLMEFPQSRGSHIWKRAKS